LLFARFERCRYSSRVRAMPTPSRCPVCTLRHQPPPLGIATASPTLPLALEGLASFEYDEAPASERDLALLTLVTRIARFVVTVQEQDDLRPVGMAEDTGAGPSHPWLPGG